MLARIARPKKPDSTELCSRLTEEELVEVITRDGDLSIEAAKRVIQFACLAPELLTQVNASFNELEKHSLCFALRPFCRIASNKNAIYLFGLKAIDHTLRFWTHIVANGRWPLVETSRTLEMALTERRENILQRLSVQARQICERYFGIVERIEPSHFLSREVSAEIGTIDVLALDPSKRVIGVFGTCDVIRGESMKTIYETYESFLDSDLLNQQKSKTQLIRDLAQLLLERLGYGGQRENDWLVVSALVSQAIYWSSYRFSDGTEIAFIPLEQLDDFVRSKMLLEPQTHRVQ